MSTTTRAVRALAALAARTLTRAATPDTDPALGSGLGEHARTLLHVLYTHADRHGHVQAAPPWALACPTYHGPVDVLTLAARQAGATRHHMVLAMTELTSIGLVASTWRPATQDDGAVTGPHGQLASGPTHVHTGWTLNPGLRRRRHAPGRREAA